MYFSYDSYLGSISRKTSRNSQVTGVAYITQLRAGQVVLHQQLAALAAAQQPAWDAQALAAALIRATASRDALVAYPVFDEGASVPEFLRAAARVLTDAELTVAEWPKTSVRYLRGLASKVGRTGKQGDHIFAMGNPGLARLAPVVKYFDGSPLPKFERIQDSLTAAKLFNSDNKDLIVASSVEGKLSTIMMSIPALQVNHVLNINCQRQWPRYQEAITSSSTQFDSPLTENLLTRILNHDQKTLKNFAL